MRSHYTLASSATIVSSQIGKAIQKGVETGQMEQKGMSPLKRIPTQILTFSGNKNSRVKLLKKPAEPKKKASETTKAEAKPKAEKAEKETKAKSTPTKKTAAAKKAPTKTTKATTASKAKASTTKKAEPAKKTEAKKAEAPKKVEKPKANTAKPRAKKASTATKADAPVSSSSATIMFTDKFRLPPLSTHQRS